ncbi:hypothetical protein BV898_13002 [Hypsibius exemplaris]|uniref:Uncharacterized protein n=1 Tax=Hypsibius exemplaris TaxID=2072580 RepID=A0A1W0WC91_HYPEX|nr:hypothetical protein BV898_13002 [Hypsibius exemplaris]
MKALAILMVCGLVVVVVAADKSGNPPRQKDWNPFQNPFSFKVAAPNAPAGFGEFAAFPTMNFGNNGFGFGNNNGFGQPSSGNQGGAAAPKPSGGFSGSSWTGFQDLSPVFADFQKQFATQFPSFWSAAPVPTNNGQQGPAPATVAATTVAAVATTVATTVATSASTVAATVAAPVAVVVPTAVPTGSGGNGGITVVNRNCSVEGQVIGLSQLSTDQCGSVECECFKGVYFCYSTCSPPPAGQSCTATIPTAGPSVCPTYSNCSPQANTTSGPSEIFRCNGAVHPSVCWLYEIVYGHLTEPLGFFESVAQGCPLTSQCVCGTNGFVQPAQLRQEDFKTPANNLVFVRTTPGAKGAFATS